MAITNPDFKSASGGSGTALSTAALSCQAKDLVVVCCKWEGTNGAGASVTYDQSTSNAGSGTLKDHANNDLHGQMFWARVVSATSIVPTFNLGSARNFRIVHAMIFRPDSGNVLVFDAEATPASGTGTGTSQKVLTGNAATISAAGLSVVSLPLYSSQETIPVDGTWTDPAGTVSEALGNVYKLPSASGSITATAKVDFDPDWIMQMVHFIQQTTGQTVSIGQVTETDTSQPATSAKALSVGQPAETNTSQPMVLNGSTVFLDAAHNRQLKDHSGALWGAVNGWSYAWYDSLSALFGAGAVPASAGTFDTNASSEARVPMPGTALTTGQSGVLLVKHPNYPTTPAIALFNIPIGP